MVTYPSFGINGQLGGIDSCVGNLNLIGDRVVSSSVISDVIDKVVKQLFQDVQKDVPQDTKALVRSWKKQKYGSTSWLAGFDIIYAAYQHRGRRYDGTRVIKNRPAGGKTGFLKDNFDKNFEKYKQLYIKEIMKYAFRGF